MRTRAGLVLFLAALGCALGSARGAGTSGPSVVGRAGPSTPYLAAPAPDGARNGSTDSTGGPASSTSGDAEIARLLSVTVAGPKERLIYIQQCEQAIARYPDTSLKTDIYRRIGDVYFVLDRLPDMERWYRKALAIDASLAKSTSIGYHLKQYAKIKLRRDGKLAALLVLGVVGCLMLLQGVRSRRLFDGRFFLRKGAAFLLVYGLAAGLVLWVDGHTASKWLLSLNKEDAESLSMITPVIPMSVVDSSRAARAAVVLLSGLIPVLIAVFYTSFARPRSRLFVGVIALLAAGSLWTHFYFVHVYDPVPTHEGLIRNGRLYLRDEPEELLLRNPQKALQANPDLLKSDNPDLREFLEEHFPNGMKGKGTGEETTHRP